MVCRIVSAVALLSVAACEQLPGGESRTVDYQPGEAGTVDHALCLLGFTAVPVTTVSTGHHLIEATINGTTGNFVLDTGANLSVINEAQAERFGVAGGSGGFPGAAATRVAGARNAEMASVDSFTIGPVAIRQDRIITADLGQLLTSLGRAAGEDVAGIVGQDVLTEHRAIIDVARPVLHLIEADRDPAPVPAEQCSGAASAEG